MVAAPSVSRRRLSSTPGTARYSPPKIKLEPRSLEGASATLLGLGTRAIQVKVRAKASRLRKNRARVEPLSLRAEPFINTSLVALLSTQQTTGRPATYCCQSTSATNTAVSSASNIIVLEAPSPKSSLRRLSISAEKKDRGTPSDPSKTPPRPHLFPGPTGS